MDPHGVPSGGDWSLQRTGALFFEGCEMCSVSDNLFIRLDGIALFVSGYNRNMTISNNEFVWIGDSAMSSWGYTDGYDGTGGDFPQFTQVLFNMVHEHGQWTKQTSAWMQSKTAQTFFQGNIFFNGPRAGINVNDGFGGGNELVNNLIFNQVRETADHGNFNSWDRQPFWTTIGNGTASFNPAYNNIHHNLFFCNYNSQACIDNDDGSTFFLNHHNFEVYGCHKDFFAGHNKYTYDSVLAYPVCWGNACGFFTAFQPGYVDGIWNISCILPTNQPWITYFSGFNPNGTNNSFPIVKDNKVYTTNTELTVSFNGETYTDAQWQAMGRDEGTQLLPIPDVDTIIQMGRDAMGF